MKTIDEPMPICEAEMERLETNWWRIANRWAWRRAYAISCRSHSRNGWMSWPMNRREVTIHRQECRLSRNGAGALAIAMQQTMAVRDALLVSIIVDERRSSRDFLMGFMANPTLPGNTRHLEESLNGSFRDASRKPDTKRCDNGVNMMFDIIRDGPRTVSCAAIGHHQLCAVVDGR